MCNCNDPTTVLDNGPQAIPMAFMPAIPIAGPIVPSLITGLTPDPEGVPPIPLPNPLPPQTWPPKPFPPIELEHPIFTFPPQPFPHLQFCTLKVPDGCWMLTVSPTNGPELVGTLRIDRAAPSGGTDNLIFSGDLYRAAQPVVSPNPVGPIGSIHSGALTAALSTRLQWFRSRRIPIYPRGRYHSYLKGINLSVPRFTFGSACQVTIDTEQFDYTQPPTGQFQGSFPASASRTLRFVLEAQPDPSPWNNSPYYTGRMFDGAIDKGSVTLVWVSAFMRRAVLEIDTLIGAVAPQPVPNAAGTGNDFFDTLYAQAGWQLTVVQDQVDVAVPAGVNANACWTSGALHALMQTVRKSSTNLDTEWRTHLVVVPATMGCSRGIMYDQIDVPREGSASFSNDGYPTSNSLNFGAAANQQQRNIPRAYLRSACHEVTHAFNQIHQENETVADNSIMTTTPSVADVLGGPTTGAAGIFPDQINIGFNATVRNHLAHMPDPVVRPGGWPFGAWFGSTSPQASDYEMFDASEVSVAVSVDPPNPALGEPVVVSWTLTNNTQMDVMIPNNVSLEGTFATLEVTDSRGRTRPVRSFSIVCDDVTLRALAPGASLISTYRVFWSTAGFAFERAGRYHVAVSVAWSANGVPVCARGGADVDVDYPLTEADNNAAALAMHPEVGMWVALDGQADHLTEAVSRVTKLIDASGKKGAGDGGGMAGSISRSRTARAFAAIAGTGTGDTVGKGVGPSKKATARPPAKKPARPVSKATAKPTPRSTGGRAKN